MTLGEGEAAADVLATRDCISEPALGVKKRIRRPGRKPCRKCIGQRKTAKPKNTRFLLRLREATRRRVASIKVLTKRIVKGFFNSVKQMFCFLVIRNNQRDGVLRTVKI